MTQENNLDNYRWLVSAEARPWLDMIARSDRSLITLSQSIRREIGIARTHMLIAQLELRRRAKVKFAQAEHMFFTRALLEQATDEAIAEYKASRFPQGRHLADLCCGIGGDLLGLAGRGAVTAVDRDPVAVLLAEANCQAVGRNAVTCVVADVAECQVDDFAAWHLDPDRRAKTTRTTRVEYFEPGPEIIDRLRSLNPQGAVKLAPATAAPESWAREAELEWIGSRGECRQQVAWFGELACHPGQCSATILAPSSPAPHRIHGRPDVVPPPADRLGRYIFEPHAAVLAAGLVGVVAEQHGLAAVSPGIVYLTGDRLVVHPALSCFEITEVMPFDVKTVRAALRARGIGHLEVKKRGVRVTPEQVRNKMQPRGDGQATLLLTKLGKKVKAILARRVTLAPEQSDESREV